MSNSKAKGWAGGLIRGLAIVLIVAALAAVGYAAYSIGLPAWQALQAEQAKLEEALLASETASDQRFKDLEESLSEQLQQLNGVDRQSLYRLRTDIEASLSSQQSSQRDAQNRLRRQILGVQSQVDRLAGSDLSQWVLAEAEFNLRLASQQLRVVGDTNIAIELLEMVKVSLDQLDDLLIADLSMALDEDIASLRAYPAPDRYAVFTRLSAVGSEIDALAVTLNAGQREAMSSASEAPEAATTIDRARAAVSAFSKFFTVSRIDDALPLSIEAQALERQLLALRFEQTVSALISKDAELYNATLLRLRQKLEELRAHNPTAIDAILTTLESLELDSALATLPDLSRSEQALGLLKQQMTAVGSER